MPATDYMYPRGVRTRSAADETRGAGLSRDEGRSTQDLLISGTPREDPLSMVALPTWGPGYWTSSVVMALSCTKEEDGTVQYSTSLQDRTDVSRLAGTILRGILGIGESGNRGSRESGGTGGARAKRAKGTEKGGRAPANDSARTEYAGTVPYRRSARDGQAVIGGQSMAGPFVDPARRFDLSSLGAA
jgi:hypothetical protein